MTHYSKEAQNGASLSEVQTSANRVEEAVKKVEELFKQYTTEKQKNSALQETLTKIFTGLKSTDAAKKPDLPLLTLTTKIASSITKNSALSGGNINKPIPAGVNVL